MRTREAAEYLRLAPSTLTKLRHYGGGPVYAKAGPRIVVYDRVDLEAWLEGTKRGATSEDHSSK